MVLNKVRSLALVVSLIYPLLSLGGTADLAVELEINEIDGVVLEQQGEFVARITNNGPDIAANGIPGGPIGLLSSTIQDNGSFTPEIQFAPAPGNDPGCTFIFTIGDPPPGGSVVYAYSLVTTTLAVNQTVTCRGVFSRNFSDGTRELTWTLFNEFDTDPVPDNNTRAVTFGISPKSVPINQPYFLILLSLLFLIIGVKYYRP